jgi:hypothetical protein
MKLTRIHLATAATLIAIAVPASPALADTTPTVVGATYITTASSTFINTNNQVSQGAVTSGDQTSS